MSRQQYTLMKYDPATGEERPYPSHAEQWRAYNGDMTAWLFNPWSGTRRNAHDVGSDTHGHLIMPPGEPLFADTDPKEQREKRKAVEARLEALPGEIAAWIKLRVARGYRDDVEALADAIKLRCWEVDGSGDFKVASVPVGGGDAEAPEWLRALPPDKRKQALAEWSKFEIANREMKAKQADKVSQTVAHPPASNAPEPENKA